PVLMEKEADVTTITLNRPESGNRQTDATWAKVTEMFDTASKESRLILFKGAGADFCLGREAMGQQPPNPLEAYAVRDRNETTFMMYSAQEIDAHKALTFGLASDVVSANDLDSAVTTLVEHLKKMSLAAVLALKEYARVAFGMSTQGATDFARNLHATVNSFS